MSVKLAAVLIFSTLGTALAGVAASKAQHEPAPENNMMAMEEESLEPSRAATQVAWSEYLRCLSTMVSAFSRNAEPAREVVRAARGMCAPARDAWVGAVRELMVAGGHPDITQSADRYIGENESNFDDELLGTVMSLRFERLHSRRPTRPPR